MNFDLTDDQTTIKRTARDFLAARYKPAVMRELAEDDRGFTDDQWSAVAELGWAGVVISEEHGGLGFGVLELALIGEELGYALAPTPLLPSIWGAVLLEAAGRDAEKRRWLPALAAGEARATVSLCDQPADTPLAVRDGVIGGRVLAVPHADCADLLVVAAGGDWHLVEMQAPGVGVQPQTSLDPTRKLATVELDGVAATPLDAEGRSGALELAHAVLLTSLAAESVGVAQRTMEMAVDYARDREQFGRPIGSYQAIAHRCAQMLLETEGARSLSYGAAYAVDHAPGTAPRAAAMAKAYAGDAGFRVSASALQVHGGIGFTWEHDLHFFLKRATANARTFGGSAEHRERVVALSVG
jgi:alkylation response protein AidB-like acyl-CoA dehydrogenase